MFDKEYTFRGTHAEKVIKLTSKIDEKNQLFRRNYDVYLMAPIVGFLFQRKSDINSNGDNSTKIFPDILMNNRDDLIFNYRLIMLLDKKHEPSIEGRIDKAFRFFNSEKAEADEILYNQYVLGGIDVLAEKLLDNATTAEGYLSNLYDFLDDMNEKYNQAIDSDHIAELCRLARD